MVVRVWIFLTTATTTVLASDCNGPAHKDSRAGLSYLSVGG